ncbi:hypothetical protein LTR37_019813 [Vermiconidia calcicola]|uniref:Uncharacterized protein n=1 Tax=Vermiconidia calcicola TaxID=1690605 RepID=A0ACC3MEV7_9PEZI|nr:hypothetical protein LTR37_019813 [Vermiconidia calcicola]
MISKDEKSAINAIFRDAVGNLDSRVIRAVENAEPETRQIIIELCGIIAHVDVEKEFSFPSSKSRKRKHHEDQYDDGGDPYKDGPAGIRSPRTKADRQRRERMAGSNLPMRSPELKKQHDFQSQYFQGKSITELRGMGCGTYTLGAKNLLFISPLGKRMDVEFMTGTGGDCGGSIRVCEKCDGLDDTRILFPAGHMGKSCHRRLA